MENTLFVTKLTSSETLVFRGYKTDNGLIATEMPLMLMLSPQGLMFMEWVLGVKTFDEWLIPFDKILFYTDKVDDQLRSNYLKNVTGLEIVNEPATPSIITK